MEQGNLKKRRITQTQAPSNEKEETKPLFSSLLAVTTPTTHILIKSCDDFTFRCSCAALSFGFRFFQQMFELPLPSTSKDGIPEVEVDEQGVVLHKLLEVVDSQAVEGKPEPTKIPDLSYLKVPLTSLTAGEEDGPPENEFHMEAGFRLVALVIEAGVKYEATKPIVDSLAWQLKPYANYRPMQTFALAARLDHSILMDEISIQFLNYNLNIVKPGFWADIGTAKSLKIYQLHYSRHIHLFKVVKNMLFDEGVATDNARGSIRCHKFEQHRSEFFRTFGEWLNTPGHEWDDFRTWISTELEMCPECSRRYVGFITKAKEAFRGPLCYSDDYNKK